MPSDDTTKPAPARRRSKRPEDDKTARIDIRVTQAEKQQIAEQAQQLGLSTSEFILLSCTDAPERLTDVLRKARPIERVDPRLVTGLARIRLQLSQMTERLGREDVPAPATYRAVLTTLLHLQKQLKELSW